MLKAILENNIIFIFIIIVILFTVTITIFYFVLNPFKKSVEKIIEKFKTENYSLPYFIAERHVVWNNMRSFFYCLHYALTLLSVFASLLTVYYASNINNESSQYIVFLALLSMCFTITNMFSNPIKSANMAQHVWRDFDVYIMTIINNKNLSIDQKNEMLINKIVQLEEYLESYER